MIVQSIEIDDGLQLEPIDTDAAVQSVQSPDGRIWIDLQAPETGELEAWLDRLAIGGLCRRLCLEARDGPAFYDARPVFNSLNAAARSPVAH